MFEETESPQLAAELERGEDGIFAGERYEAGGG